jgi:hypothetical protein
MRPELLIKIKELVNEGAIVLGPRPNRSPSLRNYPAADKVVRSVADTLWGNIDGTAVKVYRYGKGMVMDGMDMQRALNLTGIAVDVDFPRQDDSTLFIHRSTDSADIYFIANQAHRDISVEPSFRLTGRQPELWDPLTGVIRRLPAFKQQQGRTVVPLRLSSLQSVFIVFRKKATAAVSEDPGRNFPQPQLLTEINTPWTVVFDTARWGPARPVVFDTLVDWTLRPEREIKYYSGTAVYHNSFTCVRPQDGQRVFLYLGSVIAMAKVKVNGKDVGGVWTPPYRIDITDAVKTGKNELSIKVVNTWVNRLIGDSQLPVQQRKTWTSLPMYSSDSPLQASGLWGPVHIISINYGTHWSCRW